MDRLDCSNWKQQLAAGPGREGTKSVRLSHWSLYNTPTHPTAQIVKLVRQGQRPVFPPPAEQPGADQGVYESIREKYEGLVR